MACGKRAFPHALSEKLQKPISKKISHKAYQLAVQSLCDDGGSADTRVGQAGYGPGWQRAANRKGLYKPAPRKDAEAYVPSSSDMASSALWLCQGVNVSSTSEIWYGQCALSQATNWKLPLIGQGVRRLLPALLKN